VSARWALGLSFVVVGAAAACVIEPAERSPAALLVATQQALRAGDVLAMESLLARARQRFPVDRDVLLHDALLAGMRWRDDVALGDLRAVARLSGSSALADAEARGRVGEQLFAMGAWAESAGYLGAGATDYVEPLTRARWRALAALAEVLPSTRRDPLGLDVLVPLDPVGVPELLVGLGERGGAFVLDTGATFTTLSESLARSLDVESLQDGQLFPVRFGRLPLLALGELRLRAMPVLVVRDQILAMRDLLSGPGRAVDGLLGLDVIGRFHVVVDPAARTVNFASKRGLNAGNAAPCLRVDGGLRVPVQVEGRDLWFQLDTGASHSSLAESGLALLPGGAARAAPSHRAVHTPGGQRFSVRELRSVEVRVAGARFEDVSLPVIDRAPTPSGFPLHGVLGADLVLRCRLHLDGGKVLLEIR
jgi:hypothetical protein